MSGLDALRENLAGQSILGLNESCSGHRAGEYSSHFEAKDVEALLAVVRVDNAYYNRHVAGYCAGKGWNNSISVTNKNSKRPVLEQIDGSPPTSWTQVNACEYTSKAQMWMW